MYLGFFDITNMAFKFNLGSSNLNTTSGELQNASNIALANISKEWRENGNYTITIPEGYDGIGSVVAKVNVPTTINNQKKTVTYTANGSFTVSPDALYSGLSGVDIKVDVKNNLQAKTVKKLNEVVEPDSGYNGLSKVTVNVPVESKSATITQNGAYQYTPSTGKEALSKVDVNVNVQPKLEQKTITANGTYTPSAGKDGFSKVIVNCEEAGELEEKTITENGIYTPSEGKDGFSKVTVDVPGDDYYVVSKMLVAETNGEIVMLPPNVPGYSHTFFDKLIVRTRVEANNENKVIRENGIYVPSAGYDGFGKIVVEVDGYPNVEAKTVTFDKPGDYIVNPTGSFTSMNQVFVDVDIPKVTITELNSQGVRGESYEVPLNKILGGEFTSSDGKKFKIEW